MIRSCGAALCGAGMPLSKDRCSAKVATAANLVIVFPGSLIWKPAAVVHDSMESSAWQDFLSHMRVYVCLAANELWRHIVFTNW